MNRTVNLLSLNVRGLRDCKKRREIFNWLKTHHQGKRSFVLLQETHSSDSDNETWETEWGSKILYSHGTNNSRGVALLFPHKSEYTVEGYASDDDGRRLIVHLENQGCKLTIVNVYAPTQDCASEQGNFYKDLQSELEDLDLNHTVIGGDLNIYLSTQDKYLGIDSDDRIVHEFKNTLDNLDMIDIWRVKNPDTRRYTWRRHFPLTQSRLDYWIIPQELVYAVESTDIKASIKTDHSIITLQLSLSSNSKRGPGMWKFNNSLLQDIQYVTEIKELIRQIKEEMVEMENCSAKWEYIKYKIREESIAYCKNKSKLTSQFEKELLERYDTLSKLLDSGVHAGNVQYQFQITKQELEKINAYKTEGQRIRAKALEIEQGERCTRYFLRSSKRNYDIKNITKLKTASGNFVNTEKEIMSVQMSFYKSLYGEHTRTNDFDDLFLSGLPILTEENITVCEAEITLSECTQAVKGLKRGKTPGTDGLTADFYQVFWQDVKDLVLDSLQFGFINGRLSTEQKRSVLRLLPKKGKDLTDIKNWRPISLLNTDYKILASVLANRLQTVLPSIISLDQNGYLKGRYIGFNIRTICD